MKRKGSIKLILENEKKLIILAKKGNEDAFVNLFQLHYSFLYKYLLKLTLNEETSSDLAQETMLKCYEKLNSFNGDSKFSTWLIAIASRLYIDQLRKQKRETNWINQTKVALSRQLTWKAKSQGIEWSDTFTDFNNLEAEFRIPILLRHYYGYTYEEIGELLQIRPGTVKSRVHNGIKKLRKEWTFHDE